MLVLQVLAWALKATLPRLLMFLRLLEELSTHALQCCSWPSLLQIFLFSLGFNFGMLESPENRDILKPLKSSYKDRNHRNVGVPRTVSWNSQVKYWTGDSLYSTASHLLHVHWKIYTFSSQCAHAPTEESEEFWSVFSGFFLGFAKDESLLLQRFQTATNINKSIQIHTPRLSYFLFYLPSPLKDQKSVFCMYWTILCQNI